MNLAMSQAVPIDPVHCGSSLGLYIVKNENKMPMSPTPWPTTLMVEVVSAIYLKSKLSSERLTIVIIFFINYNYEYISL